jgi:hypothetical protein
VRAGLGQAGAANGQGTDGFGHRSEEDQQPVAEVLVQGGHEATGYPSTGWARAAETMRHRCAHPAAEAASSVTRSGGSTTCAPL